uniref:Thyroid stimulating hormone receptor n=1 Tax=Oryzias melastigma TaxID=30732 RepID=A0A3B3BYV3_ORYME
MKPGLFHLILTFVFMLLSVQRSLLLQVCPPLCRCDWNTNSVTCAGLEVLPLFCSCTQEVWMVGSKLLFIPQDAFISLPNVSRIHVSDDNTLTSLQRHSFFNLSRIVHIQLTSIKALSHIHQEAFKDLPNLKYLGISNTGLRSFPALQQIRSSQEDFMLEIVENAFIHVIPANSFSGISEHALTVILSGNGMKKIESLAFNGSRLEEHFSNCLCCSCRDLSETRVSSLPPLGMEALEKLRAESVWALEVMPPFSAFPHLQRAELTFPSHCCGLQTLQRWRGRSQEVVCSLIRAALGMQQDSSAGSSQRSLSGGSEFTPHNNSQSCSTRGAFSSAERLLQDFDLSMCADTDSRPSCTPTPDALNPCEDVMSRAFLRVLVWVVSLVAISANLLVLLILLMRLSNFKDKKTAKQALRDSFKVKIGKKRRKKWTHSRGLPVLFTFIYLEIHKARVRIPVRFMSFY